MHYLDTNILVYATINQDDKKLQKSQNLIESLLIKNELLISPLSLQELIFTLSKLKTPKEHVSRSVEFYRYFCRLSIDQSIISQAFQLCQKAGNGRNINDAIHMVLAVSQCDQFSTFDNGFKAFIGSANIQINILK